MSRTISAFLSLFQSDSRASKRKNAARRQTRLRVEALEDRTMMSVFHPAGPLLESLVTSRSWITYAPSRPYDGSMDPNIFPSETELREDMQQLFNEGWRGLVTYSMDGSLREVPRIAKEVGFEKVIAGLFWANDAQLAREKPAAIEEVAFIDGYVVGNEGLFFNRYTRAELADEIDMLRAATGKPVTTTEINFEYLPQNDASLSQFLLNLGDWIFPTSQTWFPPLSIRSPAQAVADTAGVFLALERLAPDRTVVIKESWWPTDGQLYSEPAATEANQVDFYQRLAETSVRFVWGEAYDQFWKTQEGPQGPHWGFHTSTGAPKAIVAALQPVYTGPYTFPGAVEVATGDVTGDGVPEIITGAGTGGGPHVKIFSTGGALLAEFLAYDPLFSGGVFVAAGNFDGDAALEVVTGAGFGGGPHVRIFNITGGTAVPLGSPLGSFYAYNPLFGGGVRVAAGNVDGLSGDEVITGAGPSGGPHAKVFRGDGTELFSFFAYDGGFRGGIYVAAGDINADGRADIVTGAGAGGGPHVKAFSGVDRALLKSFFAYDGAFIGGVRVAAARVDSDNRADIVTGAGQNGGPHVKAFSGLTDLLLASFMAYDPRFGGGVYVAAGDLNGNNLADFIIGPGPGGGRHVRLFDGSHGLITEFFGYPA